MSNSKSKSHLVHWIVWSIVVNFVGSLYGGFALPAFSSMQTLLFMFCTAILMTSLTGLSVHAISEGWEIPGAGFILLSISQGLFVTAVSIRDGKINYDAGVAGIIFMLPALVMICYYSILPWWLRIFSLLTVIPFVQIMISMFNDTYKSNSIFENILYLIFSLSTLGWAYYTWKDFKKNYPQA